MNPVIYQQISMLEPALETHTEDNLINIPGNYLMRESKCRALDAARRYLSDLHKNWIKLLKLSIWRVNQSNHLN